MSSGAARATPCDATRGATTGATASGFPNRLLVALLRLAASPERARQRRRLRVLAADPAFLKDVGISCTDALREAAKPAWRA